MDSPWGKPAWRGVAEPGAELVRPIYGLRKSVGRAGSPGCFRVDATLIYMARVPNALFAWCRVAGVVLPRASVTSLARRARIARQHMSRWVHGEHEPSLTTLFRLSEALRVPVGDVAEACRQAVEAHRQGLAVERARKAAERR